MTDICLCVRRGYFKGPQKKYHGIQNRAQINDRDKRESEREGRKTSYLTAANCYNVSLLW